MPEHAEADGNNGKTPPEPGTLHVLIVENHADTRQGIKVFLKALRYQATFAEDKAQALALAGQQTFDVLLSDISLPDGTGWELLQTLRAQGRRPAHAIAMSGLGGLFDQARSREAGFEIHLVKPFRPGELENALRRAVDSPSPADALAEPRGAAVPAKELRQRLHDGLSQHLVAAALLQGALVNHLESVFQTAADPTAALPSAVQEARQVSRLIDEALEEVLALMRSL